MRYIILALVIIPLTSTSQIFSEIFLSSEPGNVWITFNEPYSSATMGDRLYFFADVPPYSAAQIGLWYTDGTTQGSGHVKSIATNVAQSISSIIYSHNERLFLRTQELGIDIGDEDGFELWISDGSSGGTHLLKDINPFGWSSPTNFVSMGDDVYFIATHNGEEPELLWKSNGTEEGTMAVSHTATTFFNAPTQVDNNLVFFVGQNDEFGKELWKSDGTEEGTMMVKDIRTGTQGSDPKTMVSYNNRLYFSSDNGTGRQLFTSDGTEDGTFVVKDIYPSGNPDVTSLFIHNGKLYFVAESAAHGEELWTSDGTEEGTYMIKDIHLGTGDSFVTSYFLNTVFASVEDDLFFFANDGVHGEELWKTDGTEQGTMMVKDIVQGEGSCCGAYQSMFAVNGKIYFAAEGDGSGYNSKLYESDGTTAGTLSIAPPESTNAYPLSAYLDAVVFENGIFFTASFYGSNERRLWRFGEEVVVSIPEPPTTTTTGFNIYPNPANSYVNIQFPETAQWQMRLYDMQGVLIKDLQYKGNNYPLNIDNLSGGIYSIVCTGNGKNYVSRLIVRN